MKLKAKLNEWRDAGLIKDEQALGILNYEQDRSKQHLFMKLGLIGVYLIALGIISLIAANWSEISSNLKLIVYFLLLSCCAYATWHYDKKSSVIKEWLSAFYFLLILAGIGLIAQIYHLRNEPWRGLAFWTVLSLLPMLRVKLVITALLWFIALALTAIGIIDDWYSGFEMHATAVFIHLGAAFFLPAHILLRGTSAFVQAGACFFLAAFCLYLIPSLTFAFSGYSLATRYAWIGLTCLSCLWAAVLYRQLRREQASFQKLSLIIFLCVFCLHGKFIFLDAALIQHPVLRFVDLLIYTIFYLALGSLALFLQRPRIFDIALLMISLRILVLFFDLLGGLTGTGLSLILLGTIVLCVLALWHRFKGVLSQWIQAKVLQ